MDDALLVRVLDRRRRPEGTDRGNREAAAAGASQYLVIVSPRHVLHREVRPSFRRGARVEHMSDAGVIHERQRLALRFEAGDHLGRVHAGLDDLDRDLSADGTELLCQPHLPHPSFARLA